MPRTSSGAGGNVTLQLQGDFGDAVGSAADVANAALRQTAGRTTAYYPRNDDYSVDEHGNSHGVDPWTGSELILIVRLNRGLGGGGFYNFYNHPWVKLNTHSHI